MCLFVGNWLVGGFLFNVFDCWFVCILGEFVGFDLVYKFVSECIVGIGYDG